MSGCGCGCGSKGGAGVGGSVEGAFLYARSDEGSDLFLGHSEWMVRGREMCDLFLYKGCELV